MNFANFFHNPNVNVNDRVDRASTTEVDSDLISNRVKPKSIKIGILNFST